MKNMKKSFLGVFFILLLFLLSVSSNASGKLNRSNATLMVRSTLQLKLTGVSGTVKWSSSNNKIAKVDKNGKVTAVADGTAEIQAKHAGQTYRCKIKVIHETYKTVALDFHDFNSWAQEISQKERGLVNTGLGLAPNPDMSGNRYWLGNMIIERKILESKTVSLKIPLPGPGNAGYRTVKISLPSKIRYKLHRHSLSKVSGTEGLGTYMAGVVEGYIVWDSRCSCGLTSSVTWEIPDLSELTVDNAAKVTSVTTTKIQGKTRRYKSSTSVSQKQKASVSLNRSKLTLYVGKSSRLTAKIQGASKKVVWRSSKPSVASVTSKGLVKGKKAGTAVITAKANGKTAKCTVTVKRKNSSSQNKAGSTELSGLLNLTMRSAAKRLKITPIQETSYGNFAYGKKIYAYEYGKRIYYYSFQMYSEKGDADKKGAWRIEGLRSRDYTLYGMRVGSSYASCQKILKSKGYTYDNAASFGTIYCYTKKKSGQSIHLKIENGLCESITYLPKG